MCKYNYKEIIFLLGAIMTTNIEMIIIPRSQDIGGFEVHRALPFKDRRMVGPFIFWDQMGPGEFLSGHGVDVRPHPHIGLSTVTYLFNGTLDHKDSLGNDRRITPGDVNLMTAGSGIVHSERTGQDIRPQPSKLFGIQSWLAQPKNFETGAPSFEHTPYQSLPLFDEGGVKGRVILGDFCGEISPIQTQWDTLYVDLNLKKDAQIVIPKTTEERALYALNGSIKINDISYEPGRMLILTPGDEIVITAITDTHLMVLGGAVMDSPRYIWWNFVSSSKDQIEQAKQDWHQGKFAKVPGDDTEFIPLP